MIFADKLIVLRKEKSWSQEDLARELAVSRQAVSKWEQNQSIPDMENMVKLSSLFEVSVDYLVKDDMDLIERNPVDNIPLKKLSLEEAQKYLTLVFSESKNIAFAVMLLILSPISLILLTGLANSKTNKMSEPFATGLGLITLLFFVVIGVSILIYTGSKLAEYDYLDKNLLSLHSNVIDFVLEAKSIYKKEHTQKIIMGVSFCILSALPLFTAVLLSRDNDHDMIYIYAVCLVFIFVSLGVYFLIETMMKKTAYEKLLQEGEFSKEKKKSTQSQKTSSFKNKISNVYWLFISALFLSYSFISRNWGYSWLIFAIAGFFYPLIISIVSLFED